MPSEFYRRQREEFARRASVVDYSGHIPPVSVDKDGPFDYDQSRFYWPPSEDPAIKTPIQDLTDQIIEESIRSREELLMKLIKDPGVVATFGEDFMVEFQPLEFREDQEFGTRNRDEYSINVVQKWRIRRRKEEDGSPGLGRDSGGEESTDR